MDAGLAAVLGALVGGAGTVTAGVVTGWAAREQAKITARAEHHRHRIDSREAAYRAFIGSCNTLIDHVGSKYWEGARPPAPTREFAEETRRLAQAVRDGWQEIALLGPVAAAAAASACEHEAFQMAAQCFFHSASGTFALSPAEVEEIVTRVSTRHGNLKESLAAFTHVARETLDSDGAS